jgi:ribosomal protein S18 acetylase RimI-like enzyme
LDAALQFVKDLPQKGTWWIGLLVVAPELRSRGLGSELLRHFCGVAAEEGALAIKLAVSLRNPRGLRFWENAGFRDTHETCSITARSGHVENGRIMIRELVVQ